jgi:hypothetical protein
MRIDNLTMKDFGLFEDVSIPLTQLNMLKGRMAQGKTLTGEAIQFLFSGTCRTADKSGKGIQELVRQGAKVAEVSAEIETDQKYTLTRRILPSDTELLLEWNDGENSLRDKKAIREKIEGWFGGGRELMSALFSADAFLSLTDAEKKKVFFEASGISLDRAQIVAEITKLYDAETGKYAQDNVEKLEISEFDRLHNKVIKARRELKNSIPEEVKADLGVDVSQQEKLAEREDEIAGLVLAIDEWETNQAEIKTLEGTIDKLPTADPTEENKLLERKEELEGKQTDLRDSEEARLSDKLKDLNARRDKIIEYNEKMKEADRLSGLKAGLSNHECPVLREPCERLEASDKEADKKYDKEIKKLLKTPVPKDDPSDLGTQIEDTQAALRTRRATPDEEKITEELHEIDTSLDFIAENIRARQSQKKATEKIKELQKLKKPAGDKEKLATEQNEIIATLAKIEAAESIQKQNAGVKGKRAKAMAEIKIKKNLEEAFSPKGLRQSLLAVPLKAFLKRVNQAADFLLDGASLELTDEWQMFLNGTDAAGREHHTKLEGLSLGQQGLVSLCVQFVIATETGVNFVMADNFEHIDDRCQKRFLGFLKGNGLQALVRSVHHGEEIKPSGVKGVSVFHVAGGKVELVTKPMFTQTAKKKL